MNQPKNNKSKLKNFIRDFEDIIKKYDVVVVVKSSFGSISNIDSVGITEDGVGICLITDAPNVCTDCGEGGLLEIEKNRKL